jgi:rhodanese-related sulfurtransferase
MSFWKKLFGNDIPTLNIDEAETRMQENPKPYLLDVRQPGEYTQGHIPGAKLIPLDQLANRAHKLPKNREIICVCRTGNRSRIATRQLNEAGYQAINLKGGMIGWQQKGLPVKKGKK